MRIKIVPKNKARIESLFEQERGKLEIFANFWDVVGVAEVAEKWMDQYKIPKKYRKGVRIRACPARYRRTRRWKYGIPDSVHFVLERGPKDWFITEISREKILMGWDGGAEDYKITQEINGRDWLIIKEEVPEVAVNWVIEEIKWRMKRKVFDVLGSIFYVSVTTEPEEQEDQEQDQEQQEEVA